MTKVKAHLVFVARIHSGDGGPDTQAGFKGPGSGNLQGNALFRITEDMALLGRLNKTEGVVVDIPAGQAFPDLSELHKVAAEHMFQTAPAAFTISDQSELPDYKGGPPHFWNGTTWETPMPVGPNVIFSAGFRILRDVGNKPPLKVKMDIGGTTLWTDFILVVQSAV